jgi:hypothetical protein
LGSAAAHCVGEASDARGVLSVVAELVAGEEPVGAFAGAAGLDVGGLTLQASWQKLTICAVFVDVVLATPQDLAQESTTFGKRRDQ